MISVKVQTNFFASILVSSYTALARLASFAPTEPLFLKSLARWILSTWSLSLATQVGATLLIAYRIWANRVPGMRQSMIVFWMVVESGAVYIALQLLSLSLCTL